MNSKLPWLVVGSLLIASGSAPAFYEPASITPPAPMREFRGAWIATVANIDWPSTPALTVAEQKAELVNLLDHAVRLHLNAIIFQVRPMCDAFYASSLEPWSGYLTGTMGRAPEPFYDPLSFAISECHRRGLELHAWFNPYRALHFTSKSPIASNHISRTRPELVKKYDKYLWLDPGEPDVRIHSLNVVMDVVKRYDVDGVQFDDYFYPAERGPLGRFIDFPDNASWAKYGAGSGVNRDDWRRQNVNTFVQRVYESIKVAKPWVKFGISPFGIWRPGYPPSVRGNDAYAIFYADSRKWVANGWLDYFSPQLYWAVDAKEQGFAPLLRWWSEQNPKGRHLWPGLNDVEAGGKLKLDDIARQVQIARNQPGATGEIHYHLQSLITNRALADSLLTKYSQSALIPASPWLKSSPPSTPKLTIKESGTTGQVRVAWGTTNESPAVWLLQFCGTNQAWTTEILAAGQSARTLENPRTVSVRAVDRVGKLSSPATLVLKK